MFRFILLAGALIAVSVGSYVAGRTAGTVHVTNAILNPSLSDDATGHAIALVAGLQREGDGLTFGEWVKARLVRVCPSYASGDWQFRPTSGFTGGSHSIWIVGLMLRSGTRTAAECEELPSVHDLAAVYAETGEVIPRSPIIEEFQRGDSP